MRSHGFSWGFPFSAASLALIAVRAVIAQPAGDPSIKGFQDPPDLSLIHI